LINPEIARYTDYQCVFRALGMWCPQQQEMI
jgi:hypothetical protein